MYRIWFEREMPDHVAATIAGRADPIGPGTATPNDVLSRIGPADAAIASAIVTYDAPAMDRAPDLQVIARTGIGTDNVDLEAATERGIAVCNAPDAPTRSTAEHAIALLLATAKRLPNAQEALRAGGRDFFASHEGLELNSRRLGLVGVGRIGRAVAGMARGLGMDVIAFDPFVNPKDLEGSGIRVVESLEELLSTADVVSLHVPLTDTTHHLIDADAITRMKPNAILINTARGGLIDHAALLDALGHEKLFGVAVDVTDPEPLPPDHPLLHDPRVIVTPHVAAATTEAKARLYESAVAQALQVLHGERPDHLVNPDVWPHRQSDPYSEEHRT